MEGGCVIELLGLDEKYSVGMPNVYARGILFGTMFMELGDTVTVRCEKTDMVCDLDFKVKVDTNTIIPITVRASSVVHTMSWLERLRKYLLVKHFTR